MADKKKQVFMNFKITRSMDKEAPAVPLQRKLETSLTIEEVKKRLELYTGGSWEDMELELHDDEDKLVCKMEEDDVKLNTFPIAEGMSLHVVDKFEKIKEMENAEVTKFELDDATYRKKYSSVKSTIEKNKETKPKQSIPKTEIHITEMIKKRARCEVRVPKQPVKRGTVMYNGPIDNCKGTWIGVKYDRPVGKHDGSVDAKQYFKCPPRHGDFVNPAHVVVGNFPMEDLEDEI